MIFFVLLLLAIVAYGQQERIAIIQTLDDRDSIGFSELSYLTDRLREMAVNVLPKQRYGVMTTESIVAFLGSQERAMKTCKEASCLAELGRKVNADYVAQARIGRFGENLTVKVELYDSRKGNLMSSFTGSSKDIYGLLAIIDEKAENALFKKMPRVSEGINSGVFGEMLTDSRDGNEYKIVKIGNQVWMGENLNYNASGSKCYPCQNDYCQKYGRLYDWNTAKSACPKGWHLPSDAEWDVLMKSVGANAGSLLKAKDGWDFYQGSANSDTYGFSAMPSGGYFGIGFSGAGFGGYWWSATEGDAYYACIRYMFYNDENVHGFYHLKDYLLSVRCLRD